MEVCLIHLYSQGDSVEATVDSSDLACSGLSLSLSLCETCVTRLYISKISLLHAGFCG